MDDQKLLGILDQISDVLVAILATRKDKDDNGMDLLGHLLAEREKKLLRVEHDASYADGRRLVLNALVRSIETRPK